MNEMLMLARDNGTQWQHNSLCCA